MAFLAFKDSRAKRASRWVLKMIQSAPYLSPEGNFKSAMVYVMTDAIHWQL